VKIAIIGGTAFIGYWVVNALLDNGHHILLYNRGKEKFDFNNHVERIFGDKKNLDSYKSRFKDFKPDIVLDMIPMTEQDAKKVSDTFDDIAGAIVAISSQDVYSAYGKLIGIEKGNKDKIPLKENAPLRTKLYPYRNDKLQDKNHWSYTYEKILVEKVYAKYSSLPATILRLPMVYGPRDKQHRLYENLKRMDDKRPFIIIQKDLAAWKWTRAYVEDVAFGIVKAIESSSGKNRIYNIGEKNPNSMKEWIKMIGEAAEWKGEIIEKKRDSLPEKMKVKSNPEHDLVTDSSLIRSELSYMEQITREKAIKKTVEWERMNPPQNIDDYHFDYKEENRIAADYKI